jgi:ribosomal protein S18 acetylase RimI-like enzyme
MIDYKINTATEANIVSHLKNCNEIFLSCLIQKVDILSYAQKIRVNAFLFEAWENIDLIGLVAAYYNYVWQSVYITNVSVAKKYEKRGIASELMKKCVLYGQSHNFKIIKLEVAPTNANAIKLYNKFNFIPVKYQEDSLTMELEL